MGQLAQDIYTAAQAIPAVPVADPAGLLTGPQLLAIFAKVEAAVAALELVSQGARILRTPGVPDNTNDGADGDLAINLATADLYGKSAGVWSALFNLKGPAGKDATGQPGASAYQLALQQGFVGTVDQWLASLGRAGADGKSAYQLALQQGFAGTVAQWLDSLKVRGDAGQRGNGIRWESYAPTNEDGLVGDMWVHSISATKCVFYKCTASAGGVGTWSLRYTSPDAPTAPTTPGTGNYTLPQATPTVLGGVKSMGAGLVGNVTVNADGSMTVPQAGATNFAQLGGVPSDNTALAGALAAKADLINGMVPLSQLPPPLNRLTFVFPAGQASTYECPIVFLSQAGTYSVEQINNVKQADPAPSYFIDGVLTNPPLAVAVGDTISITATTPAGVKGNIILRSA